MATYVPAQRTESQQRNSNTNIPFSDLLDLAQGKNPYSTDKYSYWMDLFSGRGGTYRGGQGPAQGSFRGAQESGLGSTNPSTGDPGFWESIFGSSSSAGLGTAAGEWGAGNYAAFAVPEAGATTLGGTTGAGAGAGGGGAGAAAGGLAGLGGLALFAYLGFMEGKRQGKRYDKEANSPSGLAKRKFAEDYPDVFTDKGQSKDKPIKGAIPKFSGFDF